MKLLGAKARGLPSRHSYLFLVSACLAGINCTYRGGNKLNRRVKALTDKKEALPVCPEVLGGLPAPRENSEIVGDGGGYGVLQKTARVLSFSGKDVSKNFIVGAEKSLRLAKRYGIKTAILKSKSPACGLGSIYNGKFKRILIKGDGVLAGLLLKNGFKVFTEERFKAHAKQGLLRRN